MNAKSPFLSPVKCAAVLFFLFVAVGFGAGDAPQTDPSDDGSPVFLLAFGFIAGCVALFLIGAGIVATAILAVSGAILIALGMVSSSVFIGILRRRFSSGFRALHYQFFAIAAVPAGVGSLWLGARLFSTHLSLRDVFVIGSIAGVCGGLALAFALDRLARIAFRRFVSPANTIAVCARPLSPQNQTTNP